jgi:hypothetical protein
MGRGIEKRKAVFILWKLTLYFALLAVLMSIVPYSLEGATAFIGAVSWLILFFFFFSQREKSSKLPKCLE